MATQMFTNPIDFYCVRCKAKKQIHQAEEGYLKNGRKVLRAKCPTCNTQMVRFVKQETK